MRVIILLILIGVQQNLFAQFGDGIVPFRDGNKWGWADVHTGKVVIEPVYDSVKYEDSYSYDCVHYISYNIYKDGKKGLIGYSRDSNKYIVKVPPMYDYFEELDTVTHLYNTCLNDKEGVYHTGYGELIENKYKYIYKFGADLLKLKSYDKNSFNEGLFSLKTKQMIVPTKYRIGFSFIWNESFRFKKDLYLERSLLQDEDSNYYTLTKEMKLKEVKEGVDFRFITPSPPEIRQPCESRVFECLNPYCYNLTNSKNNHYLEVVVSTQNKYDKNYIRYGKKKFLETNNRYNNIHIVGNRKGKKFGFINKSEEILIVPEFYKIERLGTESISGLNSQLNILIGYKKNSRTLFVNSIKLIECDCDFAYCIINRHRYIRIKNGELFGFISLENLNGYRSNFKWKLIEPKYKSLEYSCFYTLRTGVLVFEATDENGETFLVNDKGIEFRR
jgi:hypothetical protein